MTDVPQSRWFHLTPSWLIVGLLVVECLLFLSDWFQWPTWHKGYAVLIAVASVGVVFALMLLWLVVALVFHSRFQFSIRSLLVLTVAVALPCSWMAVEINSAREQEVAVGEIEKLRCLVDYDWEFDASGTFLPNAQPPGPAWLRKLLGDDFFGAVTMLNSDTQITDAGLAHLARLTQLHILYLNGTQITDAGLVKIAELSQLHYLWFQNTRITDAGVNRLKQALPNCKIYRGHDHSHPQIPQVPPDAKVVDRRPTRP